jgi:4-hydroxy-tetrahydrodipicolinate synthase
MYQGTIVPLITPLSRAGSVSEEGVRRLVESVRPHVTALMPVLSSGEAWQLSVAQWRDMVMYTQRHAGGLPVLAGVLLPDTAGVVARARLAEELGVDAIAATTPFRPDIGQDEIFQHYQAIRAAVDVPLFLYNEKAVSGNQIEIGTLARICALPNVVGIKESSGSAEFTRALVARLVADGLSVPVFEGWENLLYDAGGVSGFIGPLANLDPLLCNAMLREPTPARQAGVNAACERYGLFRDDWYRWIKRELVARGVIDTDTTADTEVLL